MSTTEYRFGRFRLIPATHELWRGGELQRVPPLVFDCVAYLLRHRERMVGRDELVSAVWGRIDVADAQIRQLIARARRAVDDDARMQQAIRTVAGVGYRWVMPVDVEATDSTAGDPPSAMTGPKASAKARPDLAVERTVENRLPALASAHEEAPASPAMPRSRRRRWVVTVACVWLIAALLTYAVVRRAPTTAPLAQGQAVVVIPIEVSAPAAAGWVRLGGMDLVAGRLRAAGLPVPPTDSIVAALHSVDDPRSDAGQDRLRRILGAALIVQGSAVKSPAGWHVRLSATGADGVQHRIESDRADVVAALGAAADLLLAALGHSAPDGIESREPPSERLQRAQAAMLAGELATARAILSDESLSRRDDAEVRFRLGQLDFLEGRLEQAEAPMKALLESDDALLRPELRARALNLLALIDFRRQDCVAMDRHASGAIAVLAPGQAPADAGQALATRALAGICMERLGDALADLGQARLRMEAAGDRLGIARVDQYLGRLELQRNRPGEAVPYFKAADDVLASFGAVEPLLNNLVNLVDAQSRLLHWNEALAESERLWLLRERMADVDRRVYLGAMHAGVLIGVGRFADAQAALASMRAIAADTGVGASVLRVVQAELDWRRGRYEEALTGTTRAVSESADAPGPNDASRAYLELLRQRASIAAGKPVRADPPLRAGSATRPSALLVANAEWAAYRHHDTEAEHLFRVAAAAAEAEGVPETIAIAAQAYAEWLLGRGRANEAGAQASRVAVWASQDFDSALLQVNVFHALGQYEPWQRALRQAQSVAGEREIPSALLTAPAAGGTP